MIGKQVFRWGSEFYELPEVCCSVILQYLVLTLVRAELISLDIPSESVWLAEEFDEGWGRACRGKGKRVQEGEKGERRVMCYTCWHTRLHSLASEQDGNNIRSTWEVSNTKTPTTCAVDSWVWGWWSALLGMAYRSLTRRNDDRSVLHRRNFRTLFIRRGQRIRCRALAFRIVLLWKPANSHARPARSVHTCLHLMHTVLCERRNNCADTSRKCFLSGVSGDPRRHSPETRTRTRHCFPGVNAFPRSNTCRLARSFSLEPTNPILIPL